MRNYNCYSEALPYPPWSQDIPFTLIVSHKKQHSAIEENYDERPSYSTVCTRLPATRGLPNLLQELKTKSCGFKFPLRLHGTNELIQSLGKRYITISAAFNKLTTLTEIYTQISQEGSLRENIRKIWRGKPGSAKWVCFWDRFWVHNTHTIQLLWPVFPVI